MKSFFYYLPGEPEQSSAQKLQEKYALGYAFSETPWVRAVSAGPKGKGVVLSDGAGNAPVISKAQDWRPMVCRQKLPEAFLSFASLPAPEDLMKPEGLPEARLRLGDGQEWAFPMVRAVNLQTGEPQCQLPFRWRITEDGRWEPGDPVERWQYLWDITEPAWVSMLSDASADDADLSHEQLLEIAVALFRVNYRVGPSELNALGVFTRDCGPADLIAQCIGYDSFILWKELKKKSVSQSAVNGSPTSDGQQDLRQPTPQPAPT